MSNVLSPEARFEICKKCPLIKYAEYGPVCNKDLWLNPVTEEISKTPKDGWINGCGCYLQSRVNSSSAHCKLKKW